MGIKEDITKIYVGYYDRAPDPAGLNYWIGRANAGMTLSEIANSFAVQTESTTKYPYLANPNVVSADSFITSVYMNLFNRAPDAAGKAYWLGELAGGKPVGQMIIDIMSGAKDDANGNDLTTLNNKVAAGVDFAEKVGEIGGLDYENNDAAKAAASEVLDGVTDAAATVDAAKQETADFVATGGGTGKTLTLTTGVDNVVGTEKNDLIKATDTTLTATDTIDGGDGLDTLQVADIAGNSVDLSVASSITNIERVAWNSTSDLAGNALDLSGMAGLTDVNVKLGAVSAGQTLTVGEGATVKYEEALTGTTSSTINGGKTIDVTVKTQAVANGGNTVTVNGDASTTDVTVTQTKTTGANAAVVVNDKEHADDTKAGTLATVTLDGVTNGAAAVNSDALATLNVKNSSQNVTVDNDTADHTLAVSVNAVTGGTIADAKAKTLNVSSTGAASTGGTFSAAAATTVNIAADEALTATLTAGAATAVNVTGDSKVTLTAHTLAAEATINAAASTGGVDAGTLLVGQTFVGSAKADAATFGATTKAQNMGDGDDVATVTAKSGTGGSIDGGAGTDTLAMSSANANTIDNDTDFNADASNFEVLQITDALANDLNIANLDGLAMIDLDAGVNGSHTISNIVAGSTVEFGAAAAAPANDTTLALADATGSSDAITVKLNAAATADFGILSSTGIETLNINSTTTNGTPSGVTNQIDLGATDYTTINVSGNAALDADGVALTSVKTLTSTSSAATSFDFTGNTNDLTVNTGAGVDTITTGNGTNTVNTGAGNDVIVGGTGVDTINAGEGDDTITTGTGLDKINVGTGTDTVIVTANTSGAVYASVTGMAAGDKIQFADQGTETFTTAKVVLGGNAVFQDYLDAATASTAAAANGNYSWFQFNGNTYLVQDNSNNATFDNGTDIVVELVGLVDLSTATGGTTNELTLA